MREVLARLSRSPGRTYALATVVRTSKSAPLPPGTAMAITSEGEAIGSVSGGCVDSTVYELGQHVLADGRPRYEHFGISDDQALSVGLTCGGEIDVFIEAISPDTPEIARVTEALARDESIALATVIRGPGVGRHVIITPEDQAGSLGTDRLNSAVSHDARGLLESGSSRILEYGKTGERLETGVEVFVTSFGTQPRMLIFGATDFSAALCQAAKLLGFHVTVCDARPVFATTSRFQDADEVVRAWPHQWLTDRPLDRRTAICVLTHDSKFDVPLLKAALRTDAGYIGVMGSRRTHVERTSQLRAAGLRPEELARLHSPIGLDLGASTPAETAVSIVAEIVRDRWGGSGLPLAKTRGPIHQRTTPRTSAS